MIRKITVFLALVMLAPMVAFSQFEDERREFDEFIKREMQSFDDFVEEQNREFAKFLRETWVEYDVNAPFVRPKRPEPVKPTKYNKDLPPTSPKETPVTDVTKIPSAPVPAPEQTPQPPAVPEPVVPVVPEAPPAVPTAALKFDFYGDQVAIDPALKGAVSLTGIAENDIANAWEALSRLNYKPLVDGCLTLKKSMALNDYGYLLLAYTAAENLNTSKKANNTVLLQWFIVCQSGYRARLARSGSQLLLLFATDDRIYGNSFLRLNNEIYYIFRNKLDSEASLCTYNRDFGAATRKIDMHIATPQMFGGKTSSKNFSAKNFPLKVSASVSEKQILFYKDYPQCDFSVYANAPVSDDISNITFPQLKAAVAGKSDEQAVNMLLNFVQTAFAYKTDDEQFGYEKPLFVEETFYYPYCDCEDRSILFSCLVRTLLGLDVVFLEYPNHLATAVCFNAAVAGDYLTVGQKKYVICDPTYIGAGVGKTMPQYQNSSVKVLQQ
ncbi:MAG: hypothetical protein LBR06_08505 [Bacteroidales bacterium]|jgi:hypothetical protein|nr:hypothetical protein [Bacteroidales bacterium]